MIDGLKSRNAVASSFLWGVATSAYQSEGGYNGNLQPVTNWAEAEELEDVAKTGAAAEFWTRYEADFVRCREMGLNAFRIGIEWSRIQPCFKRGTGEPPSFDVGALNHYALMLSTCRKYGMEPVVTLHHFVHPAWLGSDPWLEPETPDLFVEYVNVAVAHMNEQLVDVYQQAPLKYFITINEPNMLVLNTYLGKQFPGKAPVGLKSMTAAYNQLLIAHIRAYEALHDLYESKKWTAPLATFNNYCSDLYWSDKILLDLVASKERGIPRENIKEYIHGKIHEFEKAFAEAKIPLRKNVSYYVGSLVKRISNSIGWRWFKPDHFKPLLDEVYASKRPRLFDYIGLDYYDPFAAHVFRWPVIGDHEFKSKTFRAWIMNSVTSKWWDWRVLPSGLHFFCQYYSADFERAVLIAENGMALRRRVDNEHSTRGDRIARSEFLKLHTQEVLRIVQEGVPLFGYLHWSLFDNYEWGSYTPRFGLFSLDYLRSSDRHVEDHYGDRPSETYAFLIHEIREQMGEGEVPV